MKQFFQLLNGEQIQVALVYSYINGFVVVIVDRRLLHVIHDDAGFVHDGFVGIDLASCPHGDGDGVGGTCVDHREVVALLAHQHGIVDTIAEAADDGFHDFDAKLMGELQKEIVGVWTAVLVLFHAYGDALGFGTADDDGQATLRVLVAQDQDIRSRRGFAIGQAYDFQIDLVHNCSIL